jgi:DNA uptake protein ComE-like DNA-binding protein
MNKIIRQWLKSYNNFSKGDRNAILILCVLLLLSVIANIVVQNVHLKSKYNYAEYGQLLNDLTAQKSNNGKSGKALFVFDPNTINQEMLDSLDIPEQVKRNILNYRKAGGRFSSVTQVQKIYGMNDSIFKAIEDYISISEKTDSGTKKESVKEQQISGFFDPNIADFNQLTQFGFNRFQASNLIEYRKKSGIFKTKSDLLKIYGIDSSFFKIIENHIQISNSEESPVATYQPVLLQIELNSADSTDLLKLNGVGSVFANRILKYRDLLGGFYSTSQLREVYNFSEETFQKIESSISADTLLIKKIRLNFAEYKDLIKHPYFSKKQAEAVLRYRQRNGSFKNILQIKTNDLVDAETFSRIRPYLSCR